MSKKKIAVIFGGRSVEHDVSILTGLQAIEATDNSLFETMPVYIDPEGCWWTGDLLLSRKSYPITKTKQKDLTPLILDLTSAETGQPGFLTLDKGMMGVKPRTIPFDIVVPAIHGSNGEDGSLQGLLAFANIPHTGCRTLGAALTMDKLAAKRLARDTGVNVLPEVAFERPAEGRFLTVEEIEKQIINAFGHLDFPLIAKPVSLGSSIGVTRVEDLDSLLAALLAIFQLDHRAMVEPCVAPLREYNIAVRRTPDGELVCSAIERPKNPSKDINSVLDFQGKYLAGGDAGGPKLDGPPSEGMVSLSRELNPRCLLTDVAGLLRQEAMRLFEAMDLGGSVRFDFLANGDSQEIWFNEANTVPGSFAYFLWEAAENRISFRDLMTDMIAEGFKSHAENRRITNVSAAGAQIFKGKD